VQETKPDPFARRELHITVLVIVVTLVLLLGLLQTLPNLKQEFVPVLQLLMDHR
jgi:hypothetical protein